MYQDINLPVRVSSSARLIHSCPHIVPDRGCRFYHRYNVPPDFETSRYSVATMAALRLDRNFPEYSYSRNPHATTAMGRQHEALD